MNDYFIYIRLNLREFRKKGKINRNQEVIRKEGEHSLFPNRTKGK